MAAMYEYLYVCCISLYMYMYMYMYVFTVFKLVCVCSIVQHYVALCIVQCCDDVALNKKIRFP